MAFGQIAGWDIAYGVYMECELDTGFRQDYAKTKQLYDNTT
jgi:hypothetical protein